MNSPETTPAPAVAAKRRWWTEPYVHLAFSILLSASAQLLMRRGASESLNHEEVLGFKGLTSGWVWLGILAHITSLLSWLYALRSAPLNIAYNLTGVIQVIVPLGSWFFLGEQIRPMRWLGIVLICAGVVITARQAGDVEEKL